METFEAPELASKRNIAMAPWRGPPSWYVPWYEGVYWLDWHYWTESIDFEYAPSRYSLPVGCRAAGFGDAY